MRAIWRRGPGPAACFYACRHGPGSPGLIASLSSASLPSPPRRAMIRAGLPRATLCLGGWGVDTPGIRTIVIKVRNDGAIIYQ
ncbi:hypothetical protein KAM448_33590 [Aeromonas caviae]|uniref:Uncharacterized protein n=1 Tax=Aeromonas caviae TaxID=648 RepID=A0ABD0B5C8_AERCA|nr:hypothetical protein KAM376_00920 [Aeromonas caviae]GJA83137.1 hypothetical protein KAM355_36970 [Aeromonas caviae]GJA97984.1 hypothetical protein KAM359_13920 [Aeromonas caviae]GJB11954.1 hypothetical protein KAM362_25140 [Aeromonas caviae]GJB23464.1 hypothetical protein KAM365_12140 [Aeromonas caviae]